MPSPETLRRFAHSIGRDSRQPSYGRATATCLHGASRPPVWSGPPSLRNLAKRAARSRTLLTNHDQTGHRRTTPGPCPRVDVRSLHPRRGRRLVQAAPRSSRPRKRSRRAGQPAEARCVLRRPQTVGPKRPAVPTARRASPSPRSVGRPPARRPSRRPRQRCPPRTRRGARPRLRRRRSNERRPGRRPSRRLRRRVARPPRAPGRQRRNAGRRARRPSRPEPVVPWPIGVTRSATGGPAIGRVFVCPPTC